MLSKPHPRGYIPSTKHLNQYVQKPVLKLLVLWMSAVSCLCNEIQMCWFGDLYYPVFFKTLHTWTTLLGPHLGKEEIQLHAFQCSFNSAASSSGWHTLQVIECFLPDLRSRFVSHWRTQHNSIKFLPLLNWHLVIWEANNTKRKQSFPSVKILWNFVTFQLAKCEEEMKKI